jgi:hypothetical protein
VSRRLLLAPVLIVLASLTFAACGTSPEDKAYDDGKAVGSAVADLYQASDVSQAKAALGDVKSAVSDIHSETRDHIQDQAQVQGATIENAVSNLQSGSLDAVRDHH